MKVFAMDRAAFNQGINAKYDFTIEEEIASCLVSRGASAVGVIYDCRNTLCKRLQRGWKSVCGRRETYRPKNRGGQLSYQSKTGSLMANSHPGSYCGQDAYNDMFVTGKAKVHSVVRRLTEMECERLQGYPDRWTDISEYIDTNGKKKKGSASARYKALGNSIALPFWQYLLENIQEEIGEEPTMGSLFDGIGGFPLCWERAGGKCLWASEIEEFPIAVTKAHFSDGK